MRISRAVPMHVSRDRTGICPNRYRYQFFERVVLAFGMLRIAGIGLFGWAPGDYHSRSRGILLLRCIEQFARNASIGHRVPVLTAHLNMQFDVLKEALSIASSIAENGPVERRRRGAHFIEKNQRHLIRCLPEPNIERLKNGQSPFVFTDWLLMHAAKGQGRSSQPSTGISNSSPKHLFESPATILPKFSSTTRGRLT